MERTKTMRRIRRDKQKEGIVLFSMLIHMQMLFLNISLHENEGHIGVNESILTIMKHISDSK